MRRTYGWYLQLDVRKYFDSIDHGILRRLLCRRFKEPAVLSLFERIIQRLMAEHPEYSRYKLSRLLCQLWDWRDPQGQVKDMAARSLLLKLQERGWIVLPPKRRASPNRMRHKRVVEVDHATEPIHAPLRELLPLEVHELSRYPQEQPLFECLLHR